MEIHRNDWQLARDISKTTGIHPLRIDAEHENMGMGRHRPTVQESLENFWKDGSSSSMSPAMSGDEYP